MIIIPYTKAFENIQSTRITFSYLYGKLESDAGFDAFGVQGVDINGMGTLTEGIYPCYFNNKKCTLYYWCFGEDYYRGLAVYDDDKKSVIYAKKCFENKGGLI